jgi:hypothetical protein
MRTRCTPKIALSPLRNGSEKLTHRRGFVERLVDEASDGAGTVRIKALDGRNRTYEVVFMHKAHTPFAAASLAALLALGACNNKPQTIVSGGPDDPQAAQLKDAKPVAPPPMIQASRTYRCADNSLVYADFYTNNTVAVRTQKGGTPATLTAADGKPPYKGSGYSLSANAAKVTFDAPGKKSQTCDV